MKKHTSSMQLYYGALLVIFLISVTNHLLAQQARDVVTEAELKLRVAAVPSLKAQLSVKAKPLTTKPPAIQSSLWTSSIILADGEKYTLVPVGSILHLPEALRSRVVAKPHGDFTFWPSFLKRNEKWISAKEVSLSLSRGNLQEASALLKSISNDPRLLVATYKGGPITILESAPLIHGVKSHRP